MYFSIHRSQRNVGMRGVATSGIVRILVASVSPLSLAWSYDCRSDLDELQGR